ncbi:hypothetical protein T484DRAFT_1776392 [Baffinella frigidus]|nr:hypothetical protein T484DRAFT_1776392 [Cryptophyta sp. CCMP2293]
MRSTWKLASSLRAEAVDALATRPRRIRVAHVRPDCLRAEARDPHSALRARPTGALVEDGELLVGVGAAEDAAARADDVATPGKAPRKQASPAVAPRDHAPPAGVGGGVSEGGAQVDYVAARQEGEGAVQVMRESEQAEAVDQTVGGVEGAAAAGVELVEEGVGGLVLLVGHGADQLVPEAAAVLGGAGEVGEVLDARDGFAVEERVSEGACEEDAPAHTEEEGGEEEDEQAGGEGAEALSQEEEEGEEEGVGGEDAAPAEIEEGVWETLRETLLVGREAQAECAREAVAQDGCVRDAVVGDAGEDEGAEVEVEEEEVKEVAGEKEEEVVCEMSAVLDQVPPHWQEEEQQQQEGEEEGERATSCIDTASPRDAEEVEAAGEEEREAHEESAEGDATEASVDTSAILDTSTSEQERSKINFFAQQMRRDFDPDFDASPIVASPTVASPAVTTPFFPPESPVTTPSAPPDAHSTTIPVPSPLVGVFFPDATSLPRSPTDMVAEGPPREEGIPFEEKDESSSSESTREEAVVSKTSSPESDSRAAQAPSGVAAAKVEVFRVRVKGAYQVEHPERIPVILIKREDSLAPDVSSSRFLVPAEISIRNLIRSVSRRMDMPEGCSVALFVAGRQIPPSSSELGSVFREHRSPDGMHPKP